MQSSVNHQNLAKFSDHIVCKIMGKTNSLQLSNSSSSSSSSTSPSPSSCRFKGVRKRSWGKWVSEIRMPRSRERIWLGSFATAQQAARAYDAALICLRGPLASLNLPHLPKPYLGITPTTKKDVQSIAAAAAASMPLDSASDSSSSFTLAAPSNFPKFEESSSQISGSLNPHSDVDSISDFSELLDDLNFLDELPPVEAYLESDLQPWRQCIS